MPVRQELRGARVPVQVYTEHLDPQAEEQLRHIAALPVVHHHVAAMPDVHMGIGATVGSVIPTRAAIIPAAVGVDIGCGMNALRLSLSAEQLPEGLGAVRAAVEARVPVGFASHPEAVVEPEVARPLGRGLKDILERHPRIAAPRRRLERTWALQLATLGGGNHFIELCLDETGAVWVMLHSGSRGIGNRIGSYFIDLAKQDMEGHLGTLPHKDLAYFREGSPHFDDYVAAVHWAQEYARVNRREMMRRVLEALAARLPPFTVTTEAVDCHHNYVSLEHHYGAPVYVTRKGAISARAGELGIIPGSMGARSFIVRGLGEEASFCSCAHGAGRRMSRREARRRFAARDLEAQTSGVECRKDPGVVDEIPGAYKDIDQVMADQSDLVEVVHSLKQVMCIKG